KKGMFIDGSLVAGMSGATDNSYTTKDSGRTWNELNWWSNCTDFQTMNDSLWFASQYTGLFNNQSFIYKSKNNFDTAGQVIGNFPGAIQCIYFFDSLRGFAGGNGLNY